MFSRKRAVRAHADARGISPQRRRRNIFILLQNARNVTVRSPISFYPFTTLLSNKADTAEYVFSVLGIEGAEAKCFRENAPSERMPARAGFRRGGEDETYLYFYKTPAM